MRKNKKYKVIVAHPYKQHSFELAEGLRRKGYLYKYITTVYYKKYNLTFWISKLLKGTLKEKAESRQDKRINNYVIQKSELLGLIKLLIMRFKCLKKYYNKFKYYSSDIFAKKVAKYVLKRDIDAIVVYDDTSYIIGKKLKEHNSKTKIIMDMSAPSLLYLTEIYKKDMQKQKAYAEQLKKERINALDNNLLMRAKNEINYADYFIVASEFSKKSLVYSGVDKNKIFICRYGVDISKFKPSKRNNNNSSKLNAIFIGGTKEYKGISYLLDAFKILKNENINLTIVGEISISEELSRQYKNIKFVGQVMHSEIATLLQESDFMIFPSLGDGFGLSVTEALACGCPVICSENAGASDLIIDYKNGFVIKSQDSQEIVDKIMFFINNRDILEKMRKCARDTVIQYSWEEYYKAVGKVLHHILDEEN